MELIRFKSEKWVIKLQSDRNQSRRNETEKDFGRENTPNQ